MHDSHERFQQLTRQRKSVNYPYCIKSFPNNHCIILQFIFETETSFKNLVFRDDDMKC